MCLQHLVVAVAADPLVETRRFLEVREEEGEGALRQRPGDAHAIDDGGYPFGSSSGRLVAAAHDPGVQ
jgi:hypothetical protein